MFIHLYKLEIQYLLQVYGTAEAAMGYSNMRQTQDNQYTANRMYAEYETNDKVGEFFSRRLFIYLFNSCIHTHIYID